MSVVAAFPGITWTDTASMTFGELRTITAMIERAARG